MTSVVAVGSAGVGDVDSLVYGYKWNTLRLTYSFPQSNAGFPQDYPEAYNNFEALNAAQRAVVLTVFAQISQFTKLVFSEASDAAGELRFAMTDAVETAFAFLPGDIAESGDAWFNNSSGVYDNPYRGGYAYATFFHEIGHALGLEHPHEGSPVMSAARDSIEFTIMSYRSYPGQPLEGGFAGPDFPTTYMMYDIAALQHMYGANFAHNAGDTLYKFDRPSNYSTHILRTLWDGGGVDTYDVSDFYNGTSVDLRPGGWTKLGWSHAADLGDSKYARGNIANALLFKGDTRSLIENAIGGPGSDTIIGNQADNRLEGGASRDWLTGGSGNDTLIGGTSSDIMDGGTGNDTYYVDYSSDRITENSGAGTDMVFSSVDWVLPAHVENLTLTRSAVNGTGNSHRNTIKGSSGANVLSGQAGDDLMYGGAGDDKLFGGLGNDRLYGEAGIDRYCFNTALDGRKNVDWIGGFSAQDDAILLDDRIFTALPEGALSAAAFRYGSRAADASDRIIYDKSTGRIFYDADGTGAVEQVLFANMSVGTSLSAADFIVY